MPLRRTDADPLTTRTCHPDEPALVQVDGVLVWRDATAADVFFGMFDCWIDWLCSRLVFVSLGGADLCRANRVRRSFSVKLRCRCYIVACMVVTGIRAGRGV